MPSNFGANLAKSFTQNVLGGLGEGLAPELTSSITNNGKFLNENFQNFRSDSRSVSAMATDFNPIKKSLNFLKDIKEIPSKVLKDMKEGYIFGNAAREDEAMDNMAGNKELFETLDALDNIDFGDNNSSSESTFDYGDSEINLNRTNTFNDSNNTYNTNIASVDSSFLASVTDKMVNSVEEVSAKVSEISSFHEDSSKNFYDRSIEFYEHTTEVLDNMNDIFSKMYKKDNVKDTVNVLDEIFGSDGFLDIGKFLEYANPFKQKLKFFDEGGMFDMMTSAAKGYLANPIKTALTFTADSIIPEVVKDQISVFQTTIKNTSKRLLFQLFNANNLTNAGPLQKMLGSIFGAGFLLNLGLNRKAEYEKGAISFDGITKRAIVDVIPQYLRKILLNVIGIAKTMGANKNITDEDDFKYDYEKGEFVTERKRKINYLDERKAKAKLEFSDLLSQRREMLEESGDTFLEPEEKKKYDEAKAISKKAEEEFIIANKDYKKSFNKLDFISRQMSETSKKLSFLSDVKNKDNIIKDLTEKQNELSNIEAKLSSNTISREDKDVLANNKTNIQSVINQLTERINKINSYSGNLSQDENELNELLAGQQSSYMSQQKEVNNLKELMSAKRKTFNTLDYKADKIRSDAIDSHNDQITKFLSAYSDMTAARGIYQFDGFTIPNLIRLVDSTGKDNTKFKNFSEVIKVANLIANDPSIIEQYDLQNPFYRNSIAKQQEKDAQLGVPTIHNDTMGVNANKTDDELIEEAKEQLKNVPIGEQSEIKKVIENLQQFGSGRNKFVDARNKIADSNNNFIKINHKFINKKQFKDDDNILYNILYDENGGLRQNIFQGNNINPELRTNIVKMLADKYEVDTIDANDTEKHNQIKEKIEEDLKNYESKALGILNDKEANNLESTKMSEFDAYKGSINSKKLKSFDEILGEGKSPFAYIKAAFEYSTSRIKYAFDKSMSFIGGIIDKFKTGLSKLVFGNDKGVATNLWEDFQDKFFSESNPFYRFIPTSWTEKYKKRKEEREKRNQEIQLQQLAINESTNKVLTDIAEMTSKSDEVQTMTAKDISEIVAMGKSDNCFSTKNRRLERMFAKFLGVFGVDVDFDRLTKDPNSFNSFSENKNVTNPLASKDENKKDEEEKKDELSKEEENSSTGSVKKKILKYSSFWDEKYTKFKSWIIGDDDIDPRSDLSLILRYKISKRLDPVLDYAKKFITGSDIIPLGKDGKKVGILGAFKYRLDKINTSIKDYIIGDDELLDTKGKKLDNKSSLLSLARSRFNLITTNLKRKLVGTDNNLMNENEDFFKLVYKRFKISVIEPAKDYLLGTKDEKGNRPLPKFLKDNEKQLKRLGIGGVAGAGAMGLLFGHPLIGAGIGMFLSSEKFKHEFFDDKNPDSVKNIIRRKLIGKNEKGLFKDDDSFITVVRKRFVESIVNPIKTSTKRFLFGDDKKDGIVTVLGRKFANYLSENDLIKRVKGVFTSYIQFAKHQMKKMFSKVTNFIVKGFKSVFDQGTKLLNFVIGKLFNIKVGKKGETLGKKAANVVGGAINKFVSANEWIAGKMDKSRRKDLLDANGNFDYQKAVDSGNEDLAFKELKNQYFDEKTGKFDEKRIFADNRKDLFTKYQNTERYNKAKEENKLHFFDRKNYKKTDDKTLTLLKEAAEHPERFKGRSLEYTEEWQQKIKNKEAELSSTSDNGLMMKVIDSLDKGNDRVVEGLKSNAITIVDKIDESVKKLINKSEGKNVTDEVKQSLVDENHGEDKEESKKETVVSNAKKSLTGDEVNAKQKEEKEKEEEKGRLESLAENMEKTAENTGPIAYLKGIGAKIITGVMMVAGTLLKTYKFFKLGIGKVLDFFTWFKEFQIVKESIDAGKNIAKDFLENHGLTDKFNSLKDKFNPTELRDKFFESKLGNKIFRTSRTGQLAEIAIRGTDKNKEIFLDHIKDKTINGFNNKADEIGNKLTERFKNNNKGSLSEKVRNNKAVIAMRGTRANRKIFLDDTFGDGTSDYVYDKVDEFNNSKYGKAASRKFNKLKGSKHVKALGKDAQSIYSHLGPKSNLAATVRGMGPLLPVAGAIAGITTLASDFSAGKEAGHDGLQLLGDTLVGQTGDSIGDMFLNAGKQAVKWGGIGMAVGSVVPVVGTVLGGTIGGVLGLVSGFFGSDPSKAFNNMSNAVTGMGDFVSKVIDDIGDAIPKAIESVFDLVTDVLLAPFNLLNSFLDEDDPDMEEASKKGGLLSAIGNFGLSIVKAVGKVAFSLITLPFKIAKKVFVDIPIKIGTKVVKTLTKTVYNVGKFVLDHSLLLPFTIARKIFKVDVDPVRDIAEWISEKMNSIKDVFAHPIDSAKKFIFGDDKDDEKKKEENKPSETNLSDEEKLAQLKQQNPEAYNAIMHPFSKPSDENEDGTSTVGKVGSGLSAAGLFSGLGFIKSNQNQSLARRYVDQALGFTPQGTLQTIDMTKGLINKAGFAARNADITTLGKGANLFSKFANSSIGSVLTKPLGSNIGTALFNIADKKGLVDPVANLINGYGYTDKVKSKIKDAGEFAGNKLATLGGEGSKLSKVGEFINANTNKIASTTNKEFIKKGINLGLQKTARGVVSKGLGVIGSGLEFYNDYKEGEKQGDTGLKLLGTTLVGKTEEGLGGMILNGIEQALKWSAIGGLALSFIPILGTGFGAMAGGILGFIAGMFGSDPSKAVDNLKRDLPEVKEKAGNILGNIGDGIKNIASAILHPFDFLMDKFEKFKKFLNGNPVDDVINWVTDKVSGIVNFVSHPIDTIADTVGGWFDSLTSSNTTKKDSSGVVHAAGGNYFEANKPQIAVVGDNKNEGEIVTPESKMYNITKAAMMDSLSSKPLSDEQLIAQLAQQNPEEFDRAMHPLKYLFGGSSDDEKLALLKQQDPEAYNLVTHPIGSLLGKTPENENSSSSYQLGQEKNGLIWNGSKWISKGSLKYGQSVGNLVWNGTEFESKTAFDTKNNQRQWMEKVFLGTTSDDTKDPLSFMDKKAREAEKGDNQNKTQCGIYGNTKDTASGLFTMGKSLKEMVAEKIQALQNRGSSSGGNGTPGTASVGADGFVTTQGNDNKSRIWAFFKSKGLSDSGTAAIMGNLQQESGFQNDVLQGGKHGEMQVDGKTGYGIAQWTYITRQQGLKNYADSLGKPTSDLDTQLNYMWQEMSMREGLIDQLKQEGDVVDQTVAFHDSYEGSADTSGAVRSVRGGYAQGIYNEFKGTNGGASVSSSSSGISTGGSGSGNSIIEIARSKIPTMTGAGHYTQGSGREDIDNNTADCSGFVNAIYRKTFGAEIANANGFTGNGDTQITGIPGTRFLDPNQAVPGDVVFMTTDWGNTPESRLKNFQECDHVGLVVDGPSHKMIDIGSKDTGLKERTWDWTNAQAFIHPNILGTGSINTNGINASSSGGSSSSNYNVGTPTYNNINNNAVITSSGQGGITTMNNMNNSQLDTIIGQLNKIIGLISSSSNSVNNSPVETSNTKEIVKQEEEHKSWLEKTIDNIFGFNKSSKKKDEEKSAIKYSDEIAPNGQHYEENDIAYLMNQSWVTTREAAIDILSKDPKYAKQELSNESNSVTVDAKNKLKPISEIPDYNRIKPEDDDLVRKAKIEWQKKNGYETEDGSSSATVNSTGYQNAAKQVAETVINKNENGGKSSNEFQPLIDLLEQIAGNTAATADNTSEQPEITVNTTNSEVTNNNETTNNNNSTTNNNSKSTERKNIFNSGLPNVSNGSSNLFKYNLKLKPSTILIAQGR